MGLAGSLWLSILPRLLLCCLPIAGAGKCLRQTATMPGLSLLYEIWAEIALISQAYVFFAVGFCRAI